jgi:hypothetical protein
MTIAAVLDDLADRQRGIIAVKQAVARGLARSSVYDVLHAHRWRCIEPGVWARPGSRWRAGEARIHAAHLAGSGKRVLTGGPRLALAGVRSFISRELPMLVAPTISPRRRAGVRYIRSAWVPQDRVEHWEEVPCAPVWRAWSDAAAIDPVQRLIKDLQNLHRLRYGGPETAAAYLGRRGVFRGRPKALQAIERTRRQLVHSGSEKRARDLLAAAGFGGVHWSPLLVTHGTRWVGEVDLPFCAIRFGVEVNGPHHDDPEVAERDRVRDAELAEEPLRWTIARYPVQLIDHQPDEFVRQVLHAAAEAAARGLEPWPCGRCA